MKKTLFYLLLISTISKAQSPWIPNVNDGFLQVGYSGLYYNEVRYNNEQRDFNRQTFDNTYQAFLDFGLMPKLGVTAILPYKSYAITEGNKTSTFNGLSNIGIGLKYQVLDKDAKAAIGARFDFNTATANYDLGLRTGFEALTFMPYFTIGSGTKKTYFYANLGYGIRGNYYSDFVRLSGELGYKLIKNAYVIGTIDLTNPVSKTSEFYTNDLPVFQKSASFLDRQSFMGAGIKLLYEFVPEKYGVTLSTIGALGANYIPFSRSYNFGLFKKF